MYGNKSIIPLRTQCTPMSWPSLVYYVQEKQQVSCWVTLQEMDLEYETYPWAWEGWDPWLWYEARKVLLKWNMSHMVQWGFWVGFLPVGSSWDQWDTCNKFGQHYHFDLVTYDTISIIWHFSAMFGAQNKSSSFLRWTCTIHAGENFWSYSINGNRYN